MADNTESITVRVKPGTRQALQCLAADLNLYCERGFKIGEPSFSKLFDYVADHADAVLEALKNV